MSHNGFEKAVLNLRAGEWVEVKSIDEILATLDSEAKLENVPFMPEMLQFAGQRFRVWKRADKTCDNIGPWSIRRMKGAVHLEGVRCDGSEHGGCQAGCLIFWKESWLKRAGPQLVPAERLLEPPLKSKEELCRLDNVLRASCASSATGETIYSCQATEVRKFTSYMRSLDPRQYVRDLLSGNLDTEYKGSSRADGMLELLLGLLQIVRAVTISLFNRVQTARHRAPYPLIAGSLDKTRSTTTNLQPGELVRVRSKEDIVATLDKQNRNRGLLFDSEMLAYCNGIYRVLRRVNRIVDEKTGTMMMMKYPCIVLEGVVCRSDFHRLCPRAIYHYWREDWLTRVSSSCLENCKKQAAEEAFQTCSATVG